MCVGYYGYEDDRVIGFSSYKYLTRADLEGRSYIITLWDYRPGIMFYDPNDEALKAQAMHDFARLDKAIRTPFNGVW